MEEKQKFDKLLALCNLKNFTIRISENLHKRFNQHINCLKHVNRIKTKQNWIEDALREKLERDEKISYEILNEKLLRFKVNENLFLEIDNKVKIIKKFRNYSKKQWILEAIYEKLDREEDPVKKCFSEKIQENPLT